MVHLRHQYPHLKLWPSASVHCSGKTFQPAYLKTARLRSVVRALCLVLTDAMPKKLYDNLGGMLRLSKDDHVTLYAHMQTGTKIFNNFFNLYTKH